MKTWSIGRLIMAGAGGTLLMILALGAFAMWRVRTLQQTTAVITGNCMPGVYLIGKIDRDLKASELEVREHIFNTSPAEMAENEKEMQRLSTEVTQLRADYEKTILRADDRALFEKILQARPAYIVAREAVVKLSREGKKAEAIALLKSQLEPAYAAYTNAVRESVDNNKQSSDSFAVTITQATAQSVTWIAIATGCTIVIGAVATLLLVGTINRVLQRTLGSIGDGAAQVASAATQVSSASQSLAAGSSEQAASVEETSASLEEMASMTRSNSDNATKATEMSQRTRAAAEAGATRTDELHRAMDAMKTSSAAIEKIVKTIEEIAFQTNILALNAAVEAARAGEAGMGFAVVADEVRSLAQRAAHAAQETATKINDAVQKSERGVTISAEVARALAEIVENVRQVDGIVAEIATASREQSQGIAQVNAALAQMDKVTQSNAGTAEENAAAAEELNAQAAAMQDVVAQLHALVHGGSVATDTDLSATVEMPAAASPHPRESAPLPKKGRALARLQKLDISDLQPARAKSAPADGEVNGFAPEPDLRIPTVRRR